jgi:hypothetical protein
VGGSRVLGLSRRAIPGDYSGLFGATEARPVVLGARVADPQHFSMHQVKKIHPDDLTWLEG